MMRRNHNSYHPCSAEVFRQRVFILAVRPGVAGRNLMKEMQCSLIRSIFLLSNKNEFNEVNSIFINSLQEFELITAQQLHKECSMRWNPLGEVPLTKWLVPKISEEDHQRLVALGNIVMPRVARFALRILSHQSYRAAS